MPPGLVCYRRFPRRRSNGLFAGKGIGDVVQKRGGVEYRLSQTPGATRRQDESPLSPGLFSTMTSCGGRWKYDIIILPFDIGVTLVQLACMYEVV
jgi:hypothetical protein